MLQLLVSRFRKFNFLNNTATTISATILCACILIYPVSVLVLQSNKEYLRVEPTSDSQSIQQSRAGDGYAVLPARPSGVSVGLLQLAAVTTLSLSLPNSHKCAVASVTDSLPWVQPHWWLDTRKCSLALKILLAVIFYYNEFITLQLFHVFGKSFHVIRRLLDYLRCHFGWSHQLCIYILAYNIMHELQFCSCAHAFVFSLNHWQPLDTGPWLSF